MKRFITVAILVAAFSMMAVTAGTASGAATPFKASYLDIANGGATATCSGARVVQKHGAVFDSETCTLSGNTSGVVTGTFVGNPTYSCPGFGTCVWFSDFDRQIATNVTLVITANGDGTFTEDVLAYY
jgi:hypothetical protein